MTDPRPGYEDTLAPYACLPGQSRGRLVKEPETASRSCFQRDRDRVIHSSSFRRLKHKTQVFVYHEGDHFRTRLTHSLEVAQIARSICRTLSLNEDLGETLALAHDLGHPPFGHAGETVLNTCMANYDGFDHNAQAIRLLTSIEHRYASFDGLNLSWESLEGLAKHNGPLVDKAFDPSNPPAELAFGLRDFNAKYDLELHTYPSAEAQIAALADDIAYSGHDLDDGLRAGMFKIEELRKIPVIAQLTDEVRWTYPKASGDILIHELVRRLINRLIADLIVESRKRLQDLKPETVEDIRNADRPVIAFTDETGRAVKALKDFLFERMYKHYLVNRMTSKAKRVVTDLFNLYITEPEVLPTEWGQKASGPNTPETARVVADFIAGMTDRFAFREHTKLFDLSKVSL
ncbi:deoxyguanosinetriphosphate triphosphohydrolase-like protein [Kordiimonas sediminis]|uniref:Deoxyguanosinetriphosphate triphosphohydrolase-like protein n=1 Tax=Kordiimonas sediminis TaxID=1735581 RepID=A0A919E7A4_9PROT|nr:deoxyguanosinetriphosphate triphosphohydrolase [Kordiimonas sediminis]GHF25955.1 deoxyguanosinetriphosphate triphosphohydrolase-like protein [Kordiimonas sediminis]